MLVPMRWVVAIAALLALSVVSGPISARVDDNWAQWRGPDGLGVSQSTSYPDEWAPDKNIAWKTPVAGRGHSSPIVWQDRIFLTTSIEGGKAPDDHKAPDSSRLRPQARLLPCRQRRRRPSLRAQGPRLRCEERQAALGADGLRRLDVRQPPQQEHLRLVHDGNGRNVGVRVLRIGGSLRVRLRRQAALEEVARRHREGRHGAWHLARHLREPAHPPVRSGDG